MSEYVPPAQLFELTIWNTGLCNLRCKYCFVYKLYENQPKKSMDEETANELIHFASHHLAPNGTIWFFGGEPFADFNSMKYIVEKARADGYRWRFGVTTNATLLTEERVLWMKRHGFNILLSIDGSRERHNKYRVYPDGRGSWDDAWRGLKLVRKYLNPSPQVRWTFAPETVEGIAEDVKLFVERYGLANIAVDAVYEVRWYEEDLKKLRQELLKLRDYYAKWYSDGIPVYSMFIRDAVSAVFNPRRWWISRCGLGEGTVGIDVDGMIYPCHRFVSSRKFQIGHVKYGFTPDRLKWIERWRKLPPYSEVPERCLNCPFKRGCNGGCIAVNYDLFGDPHVVPEAFCDIKSLVVEVFRDFVLAFKDNPTFRKVYMARSGRQCVE